MRLELTTSAVTGRRSNQLSHWALQISLLLEDYHIFKTTYMLTKQLYHNQACWSSPHPISSSQLHALPHFHLCPINLVVFKGVYSFRMGYLIWVVTYRMVCAIIEYVES